MKEVVMLTKEEYAKLFEEIRYLQKQVDRWEDQAIIEHDKKMRLWDALNMPAIEQAEKNHEADYLAWCEEIATKYEEQDYLDWCAETARKYDNLYWAQRDNCDPRDLKWIAAIRMNDMVFTQNEDTEGWNINPFCTFDDLSEQEENNAYACLYRSYFCYTEFEDDDSFWKNWFQDYENWKWLIKFRNSKI